MADPQQNPAALEQAAVAYMSSVGQPVTFDPQDMMLTDGRHIIVLSITRPADTMTIAMDPKSFMELGKKFQRVGRSALLGLTIIGDATSSDES